MVSLPVFDKNKETVLCKKEEWSWQKTLYYDKPVQPLKKNIQILRTPRAPWNLETEIWKNSDEDLRHPPPPHLRFDCTRKFSKDTILQNTKFFRLHWIWKLKQFWVFQKWINSWSNVPKTQEIDSIFIRYTLIEMAPFYSNESPDTVDNFDLLYLWQRNKFATAECLAILE